MKKFKLVAFYVSTSLLLWSCGSVNSTLANKNDAKQAAAMAKTNPPIVEKTDKSLIIRGQAVGNQPTRGISQATIESSGNRFSQKQAVQAVEQPVPQVPLKVEASPQNEEAPQVQKPPQAQEAPQVQEVPQVQEPPRVQAPSMPQEQPQSDNGIVDVVGSKDFTTSVEAALNLLKEKDNAAYQRINKYLSKIVENENSGVDVYSKTFFLGKGTVSTGDVFWLAGVIVHDAYHSELFTLNKPYTGAEAEKACNQQQKTALKNIGAPDNYLTYLDEVSESQYWEVPFEQRGW